MINEDNYTEAPEFATLVLQHSEVCTAGAPGTPTLQIGDDAPEGNRQGSAVVFEGGS